MAAAIPVIGAIIVSVVVSKVVQEIGPKIGLSEDMSNLLGMVAGAYAGGAAYAAASPTATSATEMTAAGSEMGAGVASAGQVAPSEALTASQAPAGASGAHPSVSHLPNAPTGARMADASRTGGMMTESASAPLLRPTAAPAAAPTPAQAPPPAAEKTWSERLFSPEKTMDLIMATAQGYAEGGQAQEALEYDEGVARSNEKDWAKNYPGQLSINGS